MPGMEECFCRSLGSDTKGDNVLYIVDRSISVCPYVNLYIGIYPYVRPSILRAPQMASKKSLRGIGSLREPRGV